MTRCFVRNCLGTTDHITDLERAYQIALCDTEDGDSHYMSFVMSDDKDLWIKDWTYRTDSSSKDYAGMSLSALLREAAEVMSYHEAAIDDYGQDNHSRLQDELRIRADNSERFTNQIQFRS